MKTLIRHSLLLAALLLPQLASAATLSLSPAALSVHEGDTFTERIEVASVDQAANAISGTLNFPSDLLSVASVSVSGSMLTLWVQNPAFSNSQGTVEWSGVVPNPGFTGQRGLVVSVKLTAKKAGQAHLSLVPAAVLANDGNGTNILSGTQGADITIAPGQSVPVAPAEPTTPSEPSKPGKSTTSVSPPATTSTSTAAGAATSTATSTAGVVHPVQSDALLSTLLLFVILLVLIWVWHTERRELAHRGGKAPVRARSLVHKHFGALRSAVSREIFKLGKMHSKRELTEEEEAFALRMQRMLDRAERAIEREIESA